MRLQSSVGNAGALRRFFQIAGTILLLAVCTSVQAQVTAYANAGYTTGTGGARESLDGVVLSPYFNVTAGSTPLYVYNAQVRSVNFQGFTSYLTGNNYHCSDLNPAEVTTANPTGQEASYSADLATASFTSFQLNGTTTVLVSFPTGFPVGGTLTPGTFAIGSTTSQVKILSRVTENIGPVTVYSAGNTQGYPTGSFSFTVTEQEDASGNGIPQQITVEIGGDWLNSLHIFINPPPTAANNPPTGSNVYTMTPGTSSNPKVLTMASFPSGYTAYVFPHGVYNVASALNWGSGTELYLEDGAFINYTGAATGNMPMIGMGGWPYNMEPAIVRGWGVLDGQEMQTQMINDSAAETCTAAQQVAAPMCENPSNPAQSPSGTTLGHCGSNTMILTMVDMTTALQGQVTVDGIILRNSCAWNFGMTNDIGSTTNPVTVNNIKIFGFSGAGAPSEANSDGMDLQSNQYLNVTNSFIRTEDDLIAIFAGATGAGSVSTNHVNVVGNTMWNQYAHTMLVGAPLPNSADGYAAQNILFDSNYVIHDTGKGWMMAIDDVSGGSVNNVTWSNIKVDQAIALWSIGMNPSTAATPCTAGTTCSPGIAEGTILLCNITAPTQTVLPNLIGAGAAQYEPWVQPVPNLQMAVSLPNTSSYVGSTTVSGVYDAQAIQTAPIISNVVVGGTPVSSSIVGNDFYYQDPNGWSTTPTQLPDNVVELTVRQRNTTNAATGSIWNYNQSQIPGDMVSPVFTAAACPVSSLLQVAVQMLPTVSVWPTASAITYGQSLSSSTLTGGTASTPGTFAFNTPSLVPSAGSATQSVVFTPTDTIDYKSLTGSVSVTVNPITPVVAWTAPASIPYGTTLSATQLSATAVDGSGNPIAGTFVYKVGTATLSIGQVLNAGSYPVTATFTPNSTNYVSGKTASATLTVTQIASTTVVSPSVNPALVGASVTLTATVQSSGSGLPTGSVNFYDGAALLGSGTLNVSGVASYSTSALAQGSHSISAVYAGDSNFTGSTASKVTLVVTTATDFTFVASGSTSQTVAAGSAASYQSLITPASSTFTAPVTFTATGLPTGSTATFTPATIAAGSGATAVTITIQTAAAAARNDQQPMSRTNPLLLSVLLLPLLTVGRRLRKRMTRHILALGALVLIFAGMASLTGCGGGGGSKAGAVTNYTVTITAASSGFQHSFNVNLGLQ
jgi:hypothetical protein